MVLGYMINDLTRLTQALRKDTPEQLLAKELQFRRSEIVDTIRAGKVFKTTDVCGRTLVIRAM